MISISANHNTRLAASSVDAFHRFIKDLHKNDELSEARILTLNEHHLLHVHGYECKVHHTPLTIGTYNRHKDKFCLRCAACGGSGHVSIRIGSWFEKRVRCLLSKNLVILYSHVSSEIVQDHPDASTRAIRQIYIRLTDQMEV